MAAYFLKCWDITLELAPWLLLGAAVAGVLHVLLPAGWLNRQLRGPWGVVKSVLLGVPLPLCSCGVIPVGLSLRKGGASSGASVGFLISTPQTGVDSILVSANMLGWPFALFKVTAAAVTGVLGGWAADAADKESNNPLTILDNGQDQPVERSFREWYAHVDMILQSLWRWLVAGVLISAAITIFVPESAFSGLSAYGGLAAMGVMLLISLPLYVCATASVPIAASLVAAGLPTGAALVFLMAGPATNVATIGAVRKALGMRSLLIYLGVIIAGSVAAGLLFETIIPAATVAAHLHGSHGGWWRVACAAMLLLLIAKFAVQETTPLFRTQETPDPSATSIGVDGMTCDGCTNKLRKMLLADEGVHSAQVTLSPGQAIVEHDLPQEKLLELIRRAGFTPRL